MITVDFVTTSNLGEIGIVAINQVGWLQAIELFSFEAQPIVSILLTEVASSNFLRFFMFYGGDRNHPRRIYQLGSKQYLRNV